MEIVFLTGNKNKAAEATAILGNVDNLKTKDYDLPEIQAIEGIEVVIKKAEEAFKVLGTPLFIEDTSLYFNAWGRLPGALAKWFLKTVGNEGLIKMLGPFSDRTATAETIIAYHDGSDIHTFKAQVEGVISNEPVGENGFGWDAIFIPDGQHKTLAQMTQEEKNSISTRKIALEQFKTFLQEH